MGAVVVSYCKKISLLLLVVVSTVLIICYPPDLYGLVSSKELDSIITAHSKVKKYSIAERESLPQDVIDKIKMFVFFVGHPRSGHSIVGSFMDAHPHMVIAHEFMLFKQLTTKSTLLHSKADLFNTLYSHSVHDSTSGWRYKENDWKNYTLNIESSWQGKYDQYISVIGDKSGGATSKIFLCSPGAFKVQYRQLQKTVGIPIKVIHCVRNPYDMVSTSALYMIGAKTHNITQDKYVSLFKEQMSKLQGEEFMKARFDDERLLETTVNRLENESKAVTEITNLLGPGNVLEIHNMELVRDLKSIMTKICVFLEVDCPPGYLQACSMKVFKSVYKSRELVVWPQRLQRMVQKMIETYPFFYRYSFTND